MAHITPEDRRGDLGLFEHSLAKKGTKIQVYVKVLEIETGIKLDKSKTIGTIATKNSGKILMSAHSGYSSGQKREDYCLDTSKWNTLALHHVAKQIRFKFPKNIRDNAGHPILDQQVGRAHAGHVEVLLASWFVLHVLRGEPDLADKSERYLITQLKRLREKDLGDVRTSFITIDSEPCRCCLQFLNRLAQYTGICFVIFGSRGVGPIQVRIDGQRRQDIVGDAFSDTEDEANAQAEEATVPPEDTAMSDILTPVTPAPRSVLRRPQSTWGKAVQWIPEDPDELLSSYKKKTPVYEFPGYNTEPRRDSTTPSQVANVRPVLMSSVEEGEITEHDNLDENEWEDLGDGLMVCCENTTNNNQEDNNVKCEKVAHFSPTAFTSGNSYALSAYELVEDKDMQYYEVVERPRRTEEYPQNLPLYRPDRRSASCTNILRRLAPVGIARLERFRHQEIDDSNESVFKSRYSILNPKYKR